MNVATRVFVAAFGFVVGLAARVAWREPEVPDEAAEPAIVAEVVSESVVALPPPAANDEQVLAQAVRAGCDCPRAALAGTDPQYLEPAVTEWLEEVVESCPAFAARPRRRLDCSEWPCLLSVAMNDVTDQMLSFQRPGDIGKGITCEMDGPNLVDLGGHGVASGRDNPWSDIDMYFAIRPDEPAQDHRREGIRMYAARPDADPPR